MKKILIFSVLSAIVLISCNPDKSRIKKDLNSRFTGFEIVEIRPDSSNIKQSMNRCTSIRLKALENNSIIIDLIAESYKTTNKNKLKEYYNQINLLDSLIILECDYFEKLKFDRSEKCYYVKYLLYKDERKIPLEEYYSVKPNEVLHRPIDWVDFTYDLKYDEAIDEILKYQSQVMDIKYAALGRF